jgi:hypothetical protein
MIAMLTAFTEEIDDTQAGVSAILQQLDLEYKQLKNSLALVHCSTEVIESDLVKALAEKLPFDMIGCTTVSLSTPGVISRMGLAVTVLTSDTVGFVCGVSEAVVSDAAGPVTELFKRCLEPLSQKTAMMLTFIPFMVNVGGDEFVERLDTLTGGVPIFGTISVSDDPTTIRSYTIYNGEFYPDSLVLAVLTGEVNPLFFSVSVLDKNIIEQKAVITGAARNILQKVNNMTAVQYLESIGVARGGVVSDMEVFPFLFYLEDGSRLTRACFGADDKGGVILGGGVPVNSTLALATMDFEDVVNSTGEKVSEALKSVQGRGMLIYSCMGRFWMLGMQVSAEQQKIEDCIAGAAPYHFAYSGGEVVPEFLSNGKVVTRFQNHSLIICIL